MLTQLHPKKSRDVDVLELDLEMLPLFDAASNGLPLEQPMADIVKRLGFDSFLYGLTTDTHPSRDSMTYYWTTLPREWVELYDRKNFVEIDPRIAHTCGRTSPWIWDSAELQGPPRLRQFLRDAGRFGIRSGVVVTVTDGTDARIGLMFNSSISPVDTARRAAIMRQLGTLMVFGTRFHDHFMMRVVDRGFPPAHLGAPLTSRERQCLNLAARGMTSPDIGVKLGITERTANFHFCNVISKLGVLNRQEAIAKAISQRFIRL